MADDGALLSHHACRDELEHFKGRRPRFEAALGQLQRTLEEGLCRELTVTPERRAQQIAVFCLAHQAADDFFDIVLLATHGYGIGAMKLLRPLYERVVSALYLIEHPEDVQDFTDYADIHAWQVITNAERVGVDPVTFMGRDQYDEAKKAHDHAKGRFTRRGSKRPRKSWAATDLLQLAAKVKVGNVGLEKLYGACAFWPTMLLHTTNVSLESRLTSGPNGQRLFTHGPTHAEADAALKSAHDLIVLLLYRCNEWFGWRLDIQPLAADVMRCWAEGAAGNSSAS